MAERADDAEREHGKNDQRHDGQNVEAVLGDLVERQRAEEGDHRQGGDEDGLAHHQTGNRGGTCLMRVANTLTSTRPNAKPPRCAKYATPPLAPPWMRPDVPKRICSTNQKPSTARAGSSTSVAKKISRMNVSTRARG